MGDLGHLTWARLHLATLIRSDHRLYSIVTTGENTDRYCETE